MKRFIDLSHTVESEMITYKGLPGPVITEHMSREASRSHYAEGTEFYIGKIEMVANTGTYIDSPFHRFSSGKDLSELPLSSLADIDGVVVRAEERKDRALGEEYFQNVAVANRAVIVHTGWAKHWRTEQYSEGHPFLTEDAAKYLVMAGAVLVGIDSFNIDDTADKYRPAHTILLQASIPIVEHMCGIENLPDDGFKFFAVAAKVKNFGSFPVRAFAITYNP